MGMTNTMPKCQCKIKEYTYSLFNRFKNLAYSMTNHNLLQTACKSGADNWNITTVLTFQFTINTPEISILVQIFFPSPGFKSHHCFLFLGMWSDLGNFYNYKWKRNVNMRLSFISEGKPYQSIYLKKCCNSVAHWRISTIISFTEN